MLETSGRLLRLLSLLQARPFWTGEQLADRLEVTTRTVRRDVDRLRQLGYPVDATAGHQGGYRLGAGAALPPLLLDDDEAVAVAVGLHAAATSGAVVGVEESTMAALSKLHNVLPSRLRYRVDAVLSSTIAFPRGGTPPIDPNTLLVLAQGCRGLERVRFRYETREGEVEERTVEPYRLVSTARQWYLVARDVRRNAWRTFRVDRMTDVVATGHRFELAADAPDPVEQVRQGMAVAPYSIQARVRIDAPLAEVEKYVSRSTAVMEEDGDGTLATIGANEIGWLVTVLAGLPFALEVLDPAELRKALRTHARRLAQANT